MRKQFEVDWLTVAIYVVFLIFGVLNIYAVETSAESNFEFDLSNHYTKQFIWAIISLLIGIFILLIDLKVLNYLSYYVYALSIISLIAVIFVADEAGGARAWLKIGDFKIQPSEFAKVAVALALAKVMSSHGFSFKSKRSLFLVLGIILLPIAVIILQNDTGSALVFFSLIFVLYREGLSPVIFYGLILTIVFAVLGLIIQDLAYRLYISSAVFLIVIGAFYFVSKRKKLIAHLLVILYFIGIMNGVNIAIKKVLQPHQQLRIQTLINPNIDPKGAGWNVNQSKIAIGSGGLNGKGYLRGTQTKYNFVPKQHTDFIFCTIGEEHGWIGSTVLMLLFFGFLVKLILLSEASKSRFTRIYGYSIASVLFFHYGVNIGMTMGIVPAIGIPLPFFSYGGSSMLSFTIAVFTLLNFHANRSSVLAD